MFKLNKFSVLNYANGFTHWHYKPNSVEALKNLLVEGYFNDAKDLISPGDLLTISNESFACQAAFFKKENTVIVKHLTSAQF